MIKIKQARRRNRRLADQAVPPIFAYVAVESVTFVSGTTLRLVFQSAVILTTATPPTSWNFGTGPHQIISVAQNSPSDYTVTLNGTVAAAQTYAIPAGDPNARTPTGGYVGGSTGTIAS